MVLQQVHIFITNEYNMQQILIKQIKEAKKLSLTDAFSLLDSHTVSHLINTINWPDYRYKPKYNYDLLEIAIDLLDAYNATYLQIVDNLILIEFLQNWEKTYRQ